ncbi:16S rRNA (guanine(527)-N(7))-methyltransferase RsmG [Alphaproteobacteria bacterium GH1-50]|uniref:Ribosomal RNA small subunit methyltransferase G n=1 Tax=Kangsaoukella pontilimi TaxID=2691042 RepID=A0A7C9IPN9_9RHOB|nr:16S rRNA (guanine(527)-N(7))-methyltransferase RsmG [Kangsaoukella pontilimi]MXQ08250.1 16S rRNA (guanine(527)-N(7))-methyltransferase RsmG [Kangsaoukella pontilimi]
MNSERDAFQRAVNVSRETLERLDIYESLVQKWTRRINLIAPGTLNALWSRHFLDSAQLLELAPESAETWCDLGSGGGFPGAVIAILSAERAPARSTTLIESDQRKATFLRTVSRETGVRFQVLAERIEAAEPQQADIVSARALAPLPELLPLVVRHVSASGRALLLKGAGHAVELSNALERWRFDCETHPSKTDSEAVVLNIGEIERV